MPIWPVFCRVATRVTDTLWFGELVQPNRLAQTISAARECLSFIAKLLFHVNEPDFQQRTREALQDYRLSLPHDQAIGTFAVAYAKQNAKDYAALLAAYRSGRITALMEED
ncbi:hypothetical protein D3C73_1331000 [compost metagenome]